MAQPTIWLSPLTTCNHCGKRFGDGPGESRVMADARVKWDHKHYGPWGNVCDDCIADTDLGVRFGTGLGQRYELQELPSFDGLLSAQKAWVKVEG